MYRTQTAASLIAALIAVTAVTGPAFAAATLDRIRQSGKIALGYQADAQPFSYRDESGNPSGYSIALCQAVADGLKANLGLTNLSIEWVPVTVEERFSAVQQGKVDLLCGAETETLARRKDVSFSLPIYPSGIGALLAHVLRGADGGAVGCLGRGLVHGPVLVPLLGAGQRTRATVACGQGQAPGRHVRAVVGGDRDGP